MCEQLDVCPRYNLDHRLSTADCGLYTVTTSYCRQTNICLPVMHIHVVGKGGSYTTATRTSERLANSYYFCTYTIHFCTFQDTSKMDNH